MVAGDVHYPSLTPDFQHDSQTGQDIPQLVRRPKTSRSRKYMDPTSHVSSVKLFYYLADAMPLSDDEHYHLDHCSYCQSLVEEYQPYINSSMIRAA